TIRPSKVGYTFTPPFTTFNDVANSQTNVNFTGNTSTNATPTAGSVIISEFREQGPAGSNDEFVELYNNTNSNITVTTGDGSAGWALATNGPTQVAVIPKGTVIPARA